jgi:hypothetical protein
MIKLKKKKKKKSDSSPPPRAPLSFPISIVLKYQSISVLYLSFSGTFPFAKLDLEALLKPE